MSRNEEFSSPTILSGDVDSSGSRFLGDEERWISLSRPSGTTAVAKLTGGYIYPSKSGRLTRYEAFPDGQAQGELFNLKQPRIQGWYKSADTSAVDAMNVLGVAAEESKRRYGAYPQPDETLSEDSARVVSKLAGKTVYPNYDVGADRKDRQDFGNFLANTITDKLERAELVNRENRLGAGEVPVKRHTADDLDAGRSLVRAMLAMRRGGKPATAPRSPTAVRGKQFPDPNQLTLPGL